MHDRHDPTDEECALLEHLCRSEHLAGLAYGGTTVRSSVAVDESGPPAWSPLTRHRSRHASAHVALLRCWDIERRSWAGDQHAERVLCRDPGCCRRCVLPAKGVCQPRLTSASSQWVPKRLSPCAPSITGRVRVLTGWRRRAALPITLGCRARCSCQLLSRTPNPLRIVAGPHGPPRGRRRRRSARDPLTGTVRAPRRRPTPARRRTTRGCPGGTLLRGVRLS